MKKGNARPKKTRPIARRRDGPDDILPEYDLSRGRRNPYAQKYSAANVIELDADVARIVPNAEAVNGALRALAGFIEAHAPKKDG